MTHPKIKINHPYPPALAQTIRLALEYGEVSDKAQARRERCSPKSISDRWDRIADRVGLTYGQRARSRVIIALFQMRHVEYLLWLLWILPTAILRLRIIEYIMLALVLWLGALPPGTADVLRPRSPPRTVRSQRGRGSIHSLAYMPTSYTGGSA